MRKKSAEKLAYRLLAGRDYSEKQLLEKLLAKGIDAESAQKTVSELKDAGYINDARYAEKIIESRLSRKPYGKLYLLSLLKKAGIARSTAEETVERMVTPEEELKQALRLLEGLGERRKGDPAKLYALLVRRGFTHHAAFQALREEIGSHLDITF